MRLPSFRAVLAFAALLAAGAALLLLRPGDPGRPAPGRGEGPAVGTGTGEPPPIAGTVPGPAAEAAEERVRAVLADVRAFLRGQTRVPFDSSEWEDDEAMQAGLRGLLATAEDPEDRAAAAFALARCDGDLVVASLVQAANGDYGEEVRTAGMLALAGGRAAPRASEVLVGIAHGEDDAGVAMFAAGCLSYLPPAFSWPALVQLLDGETDPERRHAIFGILGGDLPSLGTPETDLAWRYRSLVLPVRLEEPDANDRAEVVESFDALLRRIETEPNEEVRREAFRALARIPGEKALASFRRIWETAGTGERAEILQVMGPELEGGKLAYLLPGAPGLADPGQRLVLAHRLESLQDRTALAELRRWAENERDPEIREMIRRALERLSQ